MTWRRVLSWALLALLVFPYFICYGLRAFGEWSTDSMYDIRWGVHRWAHPELYRVSPKLAALKLTEEWAARAAKVEDE